MSLFASNGFLGNFYIICQSDQTSGSCNLPNQQFLGFGGTSVSLAAFAGIMALVNQQTGSRQGNANYVFYKLAGQQPTAFHDVSSGTIAMPCQTGSPNCTTTSSADQYGVLNGYSAGANYDLATGLGSVDANLLVTKWSTVTLLPSTTTLTNVSPATITHGQAVNFTAAVKPSSGTGTPTGIVSLEGGPSGNGSIASFSLTSGTVSGSTEMLPGGTYLLKAHYPGDSIYGPSDSSAITVTVGKENSQQDIFLATFDGNGHLVNGHTTTAEYGTQYLLRGNVENAAGQLCSPFGANPTSCPSGTLSFTNNGSALPGSYALNEFGYAEDASVQLSGGVDSVKANYSGDSSFKREHGHRFDHDHTSGDASGCNRHQWRSHRTIRNDLGNSRAVHRVRCNTFWNRDLLCQWLASERHSYVQHRRLAGSDTNRHVAIYVSCVGKLRSYRKLQWRCKLQFRHASAQNITVKYPAPSVTANPYSETVNYGGTASTTVLVDASNKSAYPTGTVTFSGTSLGAVACTATTDTNGNFACQATGTFTVTTGGSIQVQYSGDSNYPASYSSADIIMPDFMFSASGWVQVTAGQAQNLTVTFTSLNGLSGTVSNLGCSDLPAETTCTFSPTQPRLRATEPRQLA